MPIATPEVYAEMLARAKENSYAFPAINCTSSETVNAAIKGFADAGSDGIIQFSTGGAEFASGLGVKDMVIGAVALAKFTRAIAAKYQVASVCIKPYYVRRAAELLKGTSVLVGTVIGFPHGGSATEVAGTSVTNLPTHGTWQQYQVCIQAANAHNTDTDLGTLKVRSKPATARANRA